MKTGIWKRVFSIVLTGALLMTTLSTAMTAFAADSPEYMGHIDAAVEAAKSDAFNYVTDYKAYDGKEEQVKKYAENYIRATLDLNKQDSKKYRDVVSAGSQVRKDITTKLAGAGLSADQLTKKKRAVNEFAPTKFAKITVYAWGYGNATKISETPSSGYRTYTYDLRRDWPAKKTELSSSSGSNAAVSNIKKLAAAVEDGFLTTDISAMGFAAVDALYDKINPIIESIEECPPYWLLDMEQALPKIQTKLTEVGNKAAELALKEVKAFVEKYPNASQMTLATYNEYRDAFKAADKLGNELDSSIKNAAVTEIKNKLSAWERAAKTRAIAIVVEEAAAILATYGSNGEKITAENMAKVQSTISAINTVVSKGDFGYIKTDKNVKKAVDSLPPIQTAIDFIRGDGAGFIQSVADLKAQYEKEGSFVVPMEEAETVNTSLGNLLGNYKKLTKAVQAREDIKAAYADYQMMAAANAGPLLEARLALYESAVNKAKEDWFKDGSVKELTMFDYMHVRTSLEELDTSYAKFNGEQKKDEAVIALNEVHQALQAAYNAALENGLYTPSEFTYPQGIDADTTAQALSTLDTVLTNPELVSVLASSLGLTVTPGMDLKGLVSKLIETNLYTDATVSAIMQMIYPALQGMLGKDATMASNLDIFVLPSGVAGQISDDYPEAKAAIQAAGAWDAVNWQAVKWNVTDEDSFYKALGQGLNGLNALLNCILNNADINKVIIFVQAGLKGLEGYRETIVPLLTLLGCKDIMTPEQYQEDRSTEAMLRNILKPVIARIAEICEAPATNLASLLPQLAYFLNADGLKSILSPLHLVGTGGASAVNVNIWETLGASINLNDVNGLLSGLLTGALPGFTWVNINFAQFAGLGSGKTEMNIAGDTYTAVTGDKNKVLVVLLQYAGQVLNANGAMLRDFISQTSIDPMLAAVLESLIYQVATSQPDQIASALIHLLAPSCEIAAKPYHYADISKVPYEYAATVKKDWFAQAADGKLDAFLGQLINLSDFVDGIYTNEMINKVLSLYESISSNPSIVDTLKTLGVNTDFESVKAAAQKINVTNKSSFVAALTTALSPFNDILGLVFAGQDYELFGYSLKPNDGYSTVVIPLLEALGCTDVMRYAEYQSAVQEGSSPLEAILTQLLTRLEELAAEPVGTLIEILPNLAYFLENNNLSILLNNLLAPLIPLFSHVNVDVMEYVSKTLEAYGLPALNEIDNNLHGILNKLLKGTGITLPAIDLHKLAVLGHPEQYQSAAVVARGNAPLSTRIVADPADVVAVSLDYIAEVCQDPNNVKAITALSGNNTMVGNFLNLIGSNLPFATSMLFSLIEIDMKEPEIPTDPTDPTDPAEPTEPTDPQQPEQPAKPGDDPQFDNTIAKTGDTILPIAACSLLVAACAIFAFYKKKTD